MNITDLFETPGANPGNPCRPYVVAEAGVNHEGRMDLAKRLVEEAKEGGADAVKFQTYKAEKLAARDSPSYWDRDKEPTESQYQLFKKYDKFWKKEFEEIKRFCDVAGVEFFSTPFDVDSARFLADLMPVFKISSSDITNKPFIEFLCGFGKPIVLSIGASHFWEAARAVEWIEQAGNPLAVMHCVLNYPTAEENANIGMIRDLIQRFPRQVIGYSDHAPPGDMKVLELAALMGARILEKHFTCDKSLPGNDHYHSMDRKDLKVLLDLLDRDSAILGRFQKTALPSEDSARANARRSLVAAVNIPAGKIITAGDLTWKRPASGISPSEIAEVVGKRAAVSVAEDTILRWDMIR